MGTTSNNWDFTTLDNVLSRHVHKVIEEGVESVVVDYV